MKKILLITPPLTQLNTPYPATAYLKGFLGRKGYTVRQVDLGIELILKLFSQEGLKSIFQTVRESGLDLSYNAQRILAMERDYGNTIDPVIRFLQHKDPTLAHRICGEEYLPEASRFQTLEEMDWAFGTMGIQDKARFLATLYLDDLADLITETIDPDFGFSRYAERLGLTATSFQPLEEKLSQPETLIDEVMLAILSDHITEFEPNVVGFSVPFPGNLYGALKCGQFLNENHPEIAVVLGGGYPNTELRELDESRLFHYTDFVTLDDGESPFLRIMEYLNDEIEEERLHRTWMLKDGKVTWQNGFKGSDIPQSQVGTPDYSDLRLKAYLSVIEVANPMHRLWSDGRWNKMTIAHGCYWKRCTFCDTTLDYINRYDAAPATMLVDRMEAIITQTGQTGFHFVDEAAPPALLREIALEIISRGITLTWWANIRFEKAYSDDLCRLLAGSGCIAVSGGLEVASDRILKKIKKGVSIRQVAQVTKNFTEAGIMIHAYLMYGFPTQTEQETIDSLEVVRQLFEAGIVHSGYWHQFAMTAHSPIGQNPEQFGVRQIGPHKGSFAWNDLHHEDPKGANHEKFSPGLKKAIYNYMHGIALDHSTGEWFEFPTPRTKVKANLIEQALRQETLNESQRKEDALLWLGNQPILSFHEAKKKGKKIKKAKLTFHERGETFELVCQIKQGEWLYKQFPELTIENPSPITLGELEKSYKEQFNTDFEQFLKSYPWQELRNRGLLLLKQKS